MISEADDLEKCGDELRLAVQSGNAQEKIAHLNKVFEGYVTFKTGGFQVKEVFLATNQLDDLLDSFLDEIIDFVSLPNTSIKIYIIEFLEQIR